MKLHCLALIALCSLDLATVRAADYVWIEAENAASVNLAPRVAGWGRTELLSEGKWVHYSVDADKVAGTVPADGILMQYAFATGTAGTNELWSRIGFERVRSPFDWRVDGGAWTRVEPDALTTDLMELDLWNEVAWYKLGALPLPAGPHTLDIRVVRKADDKGKPGGIVYACDALCISARPFAPNGKFKPDDDWRTERDRLAAAQVFRLEAPATPEGRGAVALKGLWEVCRNDEQTPPADVAQPMMDRPERPFWSAIDVPGDRNTLRPDLIFAHRLWYRTRIEVPATLAGRSFVLRFPQNNLNTTVFVNGVYCGFFKHPFAAFDIDVTAGIKPGLNEVWVGIRDAWYGYATNPTNPMKLRQKFNLPLRYLSAGFQDLAYPIWNHAQSGILQTPELVVAGAPVYASDVFAKPSVSRKRLEAEVTLRNSSAKPVTGELRWQAVDTKGGKTEKTFAPQAFELAAGETRTFALGGAWSDPRLWWPDDPQLYLLRVGVAIDGALVDTSDTRFGFREWDWSTKDFRLNGVVWHGWADCHVHPTKEAWLDFYRTRNQTVMRFWGTTWQGMPPADALTFFDENGVVCRRSGILDGEAIGYFAYEQDPDLKKESPIKLDLLRNWREQMVAQVRAERNHPSVMIWSIENEYLYINCLNLHANLMDLFEAEVTKTAQDVMAADPTRPVMVDGGGATKAQTLPVHGDHYVAGEPAQYPPLAYEANPTGGGRGRWEWDQKRPRFIGEDYYMTGNHTEVAYFEGDSAFAGKPVRGVALWNRILQEGYRWAEYGAWHYWLKQTDTDQSQYVAFAPRAVFSRAWNWTFASGETVQRPFAIFNDTRHDEPITFTWALVFDGKRAGGRSQKYRVAPGANVKIEEPLPMPEVETRREGELLLTLTVGGKEVFRDVKAVSVLAPAPRPLAGLTAGQLVVYDPQGATAAFLTARRIAFTALDSLDALPADGKVLLLGKDALGTAEGGSSRLAAYAGGDRRVIVLEQTHPLRYQGLPAEMAWAENQGFTAFGEDAAHPVLAGLSDKDFFTWGADRPVYRNAYEKPGRGARSLVQCHDRLRFSALAEVAVGQGLMLLSQLAVAEQLDNNPVAQQLLFNLLGYAATYTQTFHPVFAAVDDAPDVKAALDAIGLDYTAVAGVLEALARPAPATAVLSASPANLKLLAANLAAVNGFTAKGGTVLLCGLTPDGLADYNTIVGFDHMIRPGRSERVTLPAVRDRLTAGLTAGDVALQTSKRIFSWRAGNYAVPDMFSYLVDYDDVAPFAVSDFHAYPNIVNGFVGEDGWPLIIDFPIPTNGRPSEIRITLPKAQTLTELTYDQSVNYNPTTRIALLFDGADRLAFDLPPTGDAQTFAIAPPRQARELTLQTCAWEINPAKGPSQGIDNIRLKAHRTPEFYATVKPMLNVGGLMHYLKGNGSIVLCNLLFKANEEVAENAIKKRTILATILRNLQAPFAGGRTVVAGMNLMYEPVDISPYCNQYRDEKGCFGGDKRFTLKDLPTGEQRLAGVKFNIYEMATSLVPNAIMLAGRAIPGNLAAEVRGIKIGRKADALFFLQAARVDVRRSPREIQAGKSYELARYVVTYADGQTIEIPVAAEVDVENFSQQSPAVIPGAQLAWTRPYEGTEQSAAVYAKPWSNPRPEVTIASIDFLPGRDKAGVPALLAITAARGESPSPKEHDERTRASPGRDQPPAR